MKTESYRSYSYRHIWNTIRLAQYDLKNGGKVKDFYCEQLKKMYKFLVDQNSNGESYVKTIDGINNVLADINNH